MPINIANTSIMNGGVVIDDTDDLYANILSAKNIYYFFGGSNFGYNSAGQTNGNVLNIIDRFPFAVATTNATDVGDVTVGRDLVGSGQSSYTHGYTTGGIAFPQVMSNIIDRFPFAVATTNATDVGDLIGTRQSSGGQSSETNGYNTGGYSFPLYFNTIERFPFAATTTNASDIGDMTVTRGYLTGQSSTEYGYSSGSLPVGNVIDRFPFAATTTNATDVGDLTQSRAVPGGQSSETHGYTSGGSNQGPPFIYYNIIDRFPFAVSTTNATDVGDLTITVGYQAGQSSTTHGYNSGGFTQGPPEVRYDVIERFPFSATTTNATDVGNLSDGRRRSAGQQY